jgi:predicted transcriptional regulator
MMSTRLEVRLDEDSRRKLDEIARWRGAPISTVVREMIESWYRDKDRQERHAALQRMLAAQIDIELPGPEELCRELDERYGHDADLR